MIYLILKQDVDRPRMSADGVVDPGCQGWVCMHSDREAAYAAFTNLSVGPREVASLVEIDSLAPTWRLMLEQYGCDTLREWFKQPPRHAEKYDPEAEAAHGVRVAELKAKKDGFRRRRDWQDMLHDDRRIT